MMTMHRTARSEDVVRSAEGDQIGKLLRLVGPREVIPREREARVKTAIHAVWLEDVHLRRRRRRAIWKTGALAVAALVLLGLGLAYRDRLVSVSGPRADVAAATVRSVSGLPAFTVGQVLPAATRIETGATGRLALVLESGPSVRLDADTVVELSSASELDLVSGAVYVDTGGSKGDAAAIAIRTAFGTATDVGTRFEVRVEARSVRLRVREGEVRFDREGTTHSAAAGVELTVDAAGEVSRGRVALHGAPWTWILDAAPRFELEGRSLAEILEWTSRETGWQVRFRDAGAVEPKLGEVLRGTVPELRADEAVFEVLATYGLDARLDGGTLWIETLR